MSSQPGPLIIIGAARSGTKFLRDTLAASRQVRAIPFDIAYVWRTGNESWPDDLLPVSHCNDSARRHIRDFVLGFGSGNDIVIEKTVANALRVPFVAKVFPEAKFVHLVRDGRDVVESAYRQWQSPVDWRYTLAKAQQFPLRNFRYAFWYFRNLISASGRRVWGPRYAGIDTDVRDKDLIEVCARQWVECVEQATRDLQVLSNVLTIRYEDLVSDESAWIKLGHFVGIDDIERVLERSKQSVLPDTVGKWQTGLDHQLVDKMMPITAPTLRTHGYSD